MVVGVQVPTALVFERRLGMGELVCAGSASAFLTRFTWAEPGETVSSYISLAPPGLCALDLTNGENGSGVSKCLRHLFSNGD